MELDLERLARSPWAAGAVGAMVTAMRFTPGASWPERAVNVACGSAAAGYLTPALAAWWNIQQAHYVSAAAFAIGLLGMAITAAAITAIKDLPAAKIISGWIERRG